MLPGRGPAAFVTSFSLLTYVNDPPMLIKLVVNVTIGARMPATVERHRLHVTFSAGYEQWMRSRGLVAGDWRPDTLADVR